MLKDILSLSLVSLFSLTMVVGGFYFLPVY